MKRVLEKMLLVLSLVIFIVYAHVFPLPKEKEVTDLLTVAFLDIGQGDAIYIEAPNGRQMIIDGGPKDALMRALPAVLPPGDDFIDVILITNQDADHYGGFLPLLEKYTVGAVVESGTHSTTTAYAQLEKAIDEEHATHILGRKGERIVLDWEDGVYFDILFPDRDVSSWKTNDGSIVGELVYGDISFLMMGDAAFLTEGLVLAHNDLSGTDILKVGHHGSKTSTGFPLLNEANPSLAVISAGKGNRYGHPTPETLGRLRSQGIPYLVTMDEGTVIIETDGHTFQRKTP